MAVNVTALATNDQIAGTSDASPDTLYTATGVKAQIAQITAYNAHTAPVAVSVYIVESGGTAAAIDPVAVQSIPNGAASSIVEMIGHVVPDGATIQAFAATTAVIRITASGIEYS